MNTLEQSKAELIGALQALQVPALPHRMTGDDLRAHADYLRGLAAAVDKHIKTLGEEAESATPGGFDNRYFLNQPVFGAVDGFALFELTKAADDVDENDRAEEAESKGDRRAA